MIEFPAAFGGTNLAFSQAVVAAQLANLAVLKNVPVTPDVRDALAAAVFLRLESDGVGLYSAREAASAVTRVASSVLDNVVLVRIKDLIRGIEGREDLNDPAVEAIAHPIYEGFMAGAANRELVHWTNFAELVVNHYAGKPRGPIVGVRDDGTVCTRWWLGLTDLHRNPREGPANIEEKGERRLEEYWFKGHRHRPHEDGPAVIFAHEKDSKSSGQEYFENGTWHRPAQLGPAVRYWDETGRVAEVYYEKGELHRDPKLGPAWWWVRDTRTDPKIARPRTETKYYVRGQLHRDEQDGPAVIVYDNETGVTLEEEYWQNGGLHREGGPARIARNAGGALFCEGWSVNGKTHRAPGEGPAWIIRQGNGIRIDEWYVDGCMHRDPKEGPAYIWCDTDAGTRREEFWIDGHYLPAAQGAALVERDHTGRIIREEFWDGECMHVRSPAEAEDTTHG